MKIDRLIGIITTLQQQKFVTAPYLAEKFEVSRRTINRDIEDICKAGIPIVTTQGVNGGISIMEGFALDTTIFTEQELSAIFAGLKSLDSVSNTASAEKLAQKIGGSQAISIADHMVIDLASFYKDDLAEKIDTIKQAIQESKCISFHYCYNKGEADKIIEPYLIVFKWSDWYVFGFCKERQECVGSFLSPVFLHRVEVVRPVFDRMILPAGCGGTCSYGRCGFCSTQHILHFSIL